jgi:hypothetical protein
LLASFHQSQYGRDAVLTSMRHRLVQS